MPGVTHRKRVTPAVSTAKKRIKGFSLRQSHTDSAGNMMDYMGGMFHLSQISLRISGKKTTPISKTLRPYGRHTAY